MFEFIKCPCCAGHDVISSEAAAMLEYLLDNEVLNTPQTECAPMPELTTALETELYNIRNAIYNARIREAATEEPIDPLLE